MASILGTLLLVAVAALTIWCIYSCIVHRAWAWLAYYVIAMAVIWLWNPVGFWLNLFQTLIIVGLAIMALFGQKWLDLRENMKETQRELDELNQEPV